jgi:hypothetical protein
MPRPQRRVQAGRTCYGRKGASNVGLGGPGRSGWSAAAAETEPVFGAGHRFATYTPSTSGTAAKHLDERAAVDSTMIANNFNTCNC